MAVRTVFPEPVPEKTSLRYRASLTKEDGTALAAAELSTLTLTLYALDTARTIINSVNGTNILNVGRGTIDANGLLTVILTPDDTQVLDATLAEEKHVLLFQGTYASGAKATRHEVLLTVLNLTKVP